MAFPNDSLEQKHPTLYLSAEERQLFGQVFSAADTDNLGVVTGDAALKFFPEKTKLPSEILGEIWMIADTEDKGFLTPPGFGIVLRLIGYAQAGRPVSEELALKPGGPLPRFEGINGPATAPPSASPSLALPPPPPGGPIRVPPLAADKANQYASLFDRAGPQNGLLSGATAKKIFDGAQLSNDILVRIWNLADTDMRGLLNITEFTIAMHLLTSYKSGQMKALPQTLPPGLYEAAVRRGGPLRQASGSRPTSDVPSIASNSQQVGGLTTQRTSSPLARQPYGSSVTTKQQTGGQSSDALEWAISPQEKVAYDLAFLKEDVEKRGFITGDQAVRFFSNSRLPEEDLAQIWDLSDINSEGRLSRDEFAVAMYLIKQQLDQKCPIPQSLPPNLVPPGMRRQPIPPQSSTAPTFDNTANTTKAKPAAEDLFGLDALTGPSTPAPQSTGGSSAMNSSPELTSPRSQSQTMPPSSTFKPFVPSSSFGQKMAAPPGSLPLQQSRDLQSRPSAGDDLLGDNDPTISKKLTQETTELANLSNQIGMLTNQTQELKLKKASTEQDLSQVNAQKRHFEARLAQLRSAYEQEVRDVKALDDQLIASSSETKKIQQNLTVAQNSFQSLQEQHRQLTMAIDTDQRENGTLKERLRQVNTEINQLKTQLEKARSDARQQKGLVAINKKQLSTVEAERERIKSDLASTAREHSEATSELEETNRRMRQLPAAAVSPTPSTNSQSMNPFFRRATNSERGISQSSFAPPGPASPHHNAFDSFFRTPSKTASPFTLPNHPFGIPTATSPTDLQPQFQDDVRPAEWSGLPSPSLDRYGDLDQISSSKDKDDLSLPTHLPAPSQSRQTTSSTLPQFETSQPSVLPSSLDDTAVASQHVDLPGDTTPTSRQYTSEQMPQAGASSSGKGPITSLAAENMTASSSQYSEPSTLNESISHRPAAIGIVEANDHSREFGLPSRSQSIPGSFPGDTPFYTPVDSLGFGDETLRKTNEQEENHLRGQNNATISSQPPNPVTMNEDIDSAFTNIGGREKFPDHGDDVLPRHGSGGEPSRSDTHHEFPPIQEFGGDEDSNSDSDHGFTDSFTVDLTKNQRSVPDPEHLEVTQEGASVGSISNNGSLSKRPATERTISGISELPSADAQASPPAYNQITSHGQLPGRKNSNQFPAEYDGLLPAREDPTSLSDDRERTIDFPSKTSSFVPNILNAAGYGVSGSSIPTSHMPMPAGATAAPFAYRSVESPAHTEPGQAEQSKSQKSVFDKFEDEFGDLTEAQVASNADSHDLSKEDFDDVFNPTFDTPASSKVANSFTFSDHDAFRDFEPNSSGPANSVSFPQITSAEPSNVSHDWDAIIAGLDGSTSRSNTFPPHEAFTPREAVSHDAAPIETTKFSERPPLGRALTTGTEHDDPILKRLTGMGYSRDKSLIALEKFDYNLEKAADHLTTKG